MLCNESVALGEPDNFMTVRHLTIRGSNFEIGQKLGQLGQQRHSYEPSRYAADPSFARARRVYLQRNYPVLWERVRGVAAAFGADRENDNYDFTNLAYHLDMPLLTPGCSVVYYPPQTTATGHGYLSRNYDFSTGTMADVMGVPLPPDVRSRVRPVMSEPYIMEWYPQDGGYSSIAIHAFDLLGGTMDGMNSKGLVVSMMADEEALAELGPRLELHPGQARATGLYELQLPRLLLDTCATADEAKEALLTVKQYYAYVPLHYIVADRSGSSFVYENSTGRNVQYVIDGRGQPQVVTNFQLHKHSTPEQMPSGPLTFETNAFWRYRLLADLLAQQRGLFELEDVRYNNTRVNFRDIFAKVSPDSLPWSRVANIAPRTLWHSIYDQQTGNVEISFYLREGVGNAAEPGEVRSEYLRFALAID